MLTGALLVLAVLAGCAHGGTGKDRGATIACRIRITPAAGGAQVVITTPVIRIPKRRR